MPILKIPNDATIHTLRNFLTVNAPFVDPEKPALLSLHPTWAYMDPMALAMAAAWGGWCKRNGHRINAQNLGKHANYGVRMHLFQHLGIPHASILTEHEEAGRFLPLTRVTNREELTGVIANLSALLHLDREPAGLAAVQYCVSELLRNVLEHSGSAEGAYVCAQRYLTKKTNPSRVTIAVADCGAGIPEHLGYAYPEAREDSRRALSLAMRPGITGAQRGMYGTPENAGAGLFITRAIAKATGGYFVLLSADAAFRLRRFVPSSELTLFWDALEDPRHDLWTLENKWQGTVAAVEIVTDKISDFPGFFRWILSQMPSRKKTTGKIKFT